MICGHDSVFRGCWTLPNQSTNGSTKLSLQKEKQSRRAWSHQLAVVSVASSTRGLRRVSKQAEVRDHVAAAELQRSLPPLMHFSGALHAAAHALDPRTPPSHTGAEAQALVVRCSCSPRAPRQLVPVPASPTLVFGLRWGVPSACWSWRAASASATLGVRALVPRRPLWKRERPAPPAVCRPGRRERESWLLPCLPGEMSFSFYRSRPDE